jgi:hypothetical protein
MVTKLNTKLRHYTQKWLSGIEDIGKILDWRWRDELSEIGI